MADGHIRFVRPEDCTVRKFVRDMGAKKFGKGNLRSVEDDAAEMER